MNCAIICIGTELLFGSTLNTNATFLSQQLNLLGFNVLYHLVVGDNPDRLKESIEYLRDKTDLIITTGGLGPTEDDLSKETIALVYNKKLLLNENARLKIQSYFESTGRVMPSNNIKQALLPEGSICFENSKGTAPGFGIKDGNKLIVSMPGPPKEMMNMWQEEIKPYLEKLSDEQYYSKTLRFFGIGESMLEEKLIRLIHGQSDPTYATYAKEGQCTLRITSKDIDVKKAKERVEKGIAKVNELVGQYIYSYDDEELADVVGRKLISKGLTVSAAESCTAGMFTSTLGNVSGISACLKQSFVTYSNEAKMSLLGVSRETIDKYTEVSPQTALEMARGLNKVTGSDICISVTGYAGPGGGTKENPVGTVYIGMVFGDKEEVIKLKRSNISRFSIRNYSVLAMLDLINKSL